jgi:excisionase family DNA binding protein
MTLENEYYTLKQAADYLHVSTYTLRRAVWTKKIVAYRVGNAIDPNKRPMRFKRECLDRYADQSLTP